MREAFEKSRLLGVPGPTAALAPGFKGVCAAIAASAMLHGAVMAATVMGWGETPPFAGTPVVVELVFISPDPGGSGEPAGNESRADLSLADAKVQGVMQPVPVEPQASPPESAKRPTEKAAAEEKPSEDFPAKTVPLPKDPTAAPLAAAPPATAEMAAAIPKAANLPATAARGNLDASPAGPGHEGYLDGPKFQMGSARNPLPRYPRMARRRGIEGRVVLRVLVGADGLPLSIDVHKSSGHSVLDRTAVKAFGKWQFQPARRAGIAVTASVDIPISFRLRD